MTESELGSLVLGPGGTEPSSRGVCEQTEKEKSGNLSAEDPDNYPLNSSWSFWFHK